MKKLALMMIFSVAGVVLSAEEYTIQTISAQKESSITPAFEKKVEKSHLPITKKKEGECNIVTVGHYKSAKEAKVDLKKAKAVAKDAFVRPLDRTTPKACESKAVASKGTSSEPKVEKTVTVIVQKVKEDALIAEKAVTPVASVAVQAATPQEMKAEPVKVQACESTPAPVYVYDRNIARKSDIQEAIDYYKRSPYYTFKPVLTQR